MYSRFFLILQCQKINVKSKLCQLQRGKEPKGEKMELMNDDEKNDYLVNANKQRSELKREQLGKMNEEDFVK